MEMVLVYHDADTDRVQDSGEVYMEAAYDALGRRIQTVHKPQGGSPVTTRYVYDGQNVLVEYDGADQPLRWYVNGPTYIDERVSIHDAASDSEWWCP